MSRFKRFCYAILDEYFNSSYNIGDNYTPNYKVYHYTQNNIEKKVAIIVYDCENIKYRRLNSFITSLEVHDLKKGIILIPTNAKVHPRVDYYIKDTEQYSDDYGMHLKYFFVSESSENVFINTILNWLHVSSNSAHNRAHKHKNYFSIKTLSWRKLFCLQQPKIIIFLPSNETISIPIFINCKHDFLDIIFRLRKFIIDNNDEFPTTICESWHSWCDENQLRIEDAVYDIHNCSNIYLQVSRKCSSNFIQKVVEDRNLYTYEQNYDSTELDKHRLINNKLFAQILF